MGRAIGGIHLAAIGVALPPLNQGDLASAVAPHQAAVLDLAATCRKGGVRTACISFLLEGMFVM